MNEQTYWKYAQDAAKQIGWLPETIFTQWAWETAHFTSSNLKNNNNIAGQTWYVGCGYERGTPRPRNEGGYYIKYNSPVDGYVAFIKKNHRYDNVKLAKTVEEQIKTIAKDGWAADPNYANGLISLHQANIKKGVYTYETVAPKPAPKPAPKKIAYPLPKPVLKKGSNGDGVKQLQNALNALDFNCGKADGDFGAKTVDALKRFQSVYCNPADGSYGEKTKDALHKELSRRFS